MSNETQPQYGWEHHLSITPEIWRSAILQMREYYQQKIDESRQRKADQMLEDVRLALKLEVANRIASAAMIEEIKQELRERNKRDDAEQWSDFDAIEVVIALDAVLDGDDIRQQAHDNFVKWYWELTSGKPWPL